MIWRHTVDFAFLLVFESLVRSSFLLPQGLNHNHDWSTFVLEVKKTGPDHKKTKNCG